MLINHSANGRQFNMGALPLPRSPFKDRGSRGGREASLAGALQIGKGTRTGYRCRKIKTDCGNSK
jgi:hypothetical protein